MSSEPEEKIIAGVTKGALEFTWEKIQTWLTKLRNRELAFVEDPRVINVVKEQRKHPSGIFSGNM